MRSPAPLLALLAAAVLLAACRAAGTVVGTTAKLTYGTAKIATQTAYGTAKVATKTAIGTAKIAGTLVKDFAYYAAKAATYKNYHDSGELASGQVAGVLGRRTPKRPAYTGAYRWPLGAGIVSSEFGPRWKKKHEGLDIAADEGEPVFAAAAGKVLYADSRMRGYGNVVILRHDSKVTTLYAHNQSLKVRLGDEVKQGQVIARLGSTGHSTGPHVHFELRKDNVPVDPRRMLPKSRF